MDRCSFATVLVGSCALFREGLARILSAAEFRIASATSHVLDVAPGSLPQDQPILLIIDVGTDQAATIKDIRLFKGQYPTARVALVANHDQLSDSNIVAAFRAGADAYFLKPSCDTFIKSLELVILGETILPFEVLSYILHHYTEASSRVTRGSHPRKPTPNTRRGCRFGKNASCAA
jgi:two-component system nitrate/nitrite response regulator NarL